MKVIAPDVARKAQAGQFIIVRMHERAERVPLTIADYDREAGTITIVFQEVGKATEELGALQAGESVLNFVGPLGCPSVIEHYGHVICVGGGVGIAPVHPVARAMRAGGNRVTSIIGARSKGLLFFEEEMRQVSDRLYVVTDDGSYGRKGFVTGQLQDLIDSGDKPDLVFAVGPVPMMKAVAELTKKYGIKTVVSLNPIMVDGTGMCGGCRVSVNGEAKFACVDGPDFDAHQVDFTLLLQRQKMYLKEEKLALQNWHQCNCGGAGR
jgi:ferredoxin--NADP+ reductase